MKNTVVLAKQDVYLFLVSAVRYALGSRTYIVGWVCRQVRVIAPCLKDFQRKVIRDAIRKCEDFGGKYNEREWLRLLEWLEEYDHVITIIRTETAKR